MPAQLWFLRHGEAEPHGTRPDPERQLTTRGEEQSRAAGAALRALGVPIAHVFASPKVRARDTAALAAQAGDLPAPSLHDEIVGLDRAAALALAAAAGGTDGHVLLVGHEPDFSQVVHDLTGTRADVKKGGVVGVRLEAPGELLVLLRPRELAAIAGVPTP
jgi:phosphohistidine phosphatase